MFLIEVVGTSPAIALTRNFFYPKGNAFGKAKFLIFLHVLF